MKVHAGLLLAATALAVVVAAIYWLPHRHAATRDAWIAPAATPPGITLQLRSGKNRSRGTSQQVYADARGMTLYTFDKDVRGGAPACADDCARTWPPAIAQGQVAADGDWSQVVRRDGARQWTHDGLPLYRHADDQEIGDVGGDGADDGRWHVASYEPGHAMALPGDVAVADLTDAGGAALVNSEGLTLYTYDGNSQSCNEECAQHWLPLIAPQIANAPEHFKVLSREDGIAQWTYRDRPLYRFAGDVRKGDVKGLDIDAQFRVALVLRQFMPADAIIHRDQELGTILATTAGATLYQRDRAEPDEGHNFRIDHGAPYLGRALGISTCDAACAKVWPPYLAPSTAVPSGHWDVIARSDGQRQWVYKGYALYTYSADAPGEARGNETYDFVQMTNVALPDNELRGAHTPPIGGTEGTNVRRVIAGADVSGAGVGAMFWRAVVP
jgi:predicted lipoprotein with Yx(FWY)xxD motif